MSLCYKYLNSSIIAGMYLWNGWTWHMILEYNIRDWKESIEKLYYKKLSLIEVSLLWKTKYSKSLELITLPLWEHVAENMTIMKNKLLLGCYKLHLAYFSTTSKLIITNWKTSNESIHIYTEYTKATGNNLNIRPSITVKVLLAIISWMVR